MKAQTPLIEDVPVVAYADKWDHAQSIGSECWEAIKLLNDARPLLADYLRTIGFGEEASKVKGVLNRIESLALERRRCITTGAHWRNGQ